MRSDDRLTPTPERASSRERLLAELEEIAKGNSGVARFLMLLGSQGLPPEIEISYLEAKLDEYRRPVTPEEAADRVRDYCEAAAEFESLRERDKRRLRSMRITPMARAIVSRQLAQPAPCRYHVRTASRRARRNVRTAPKRTRAPDSSSDEPEPPLGRRPLRAA